MTLNSTLSKHPYAQINLKLLSVKLQKANKDEFRHSSYSPLLFTYPHLLHPPLQGLAQK